MLLSQNDIDALTTEGYVLDPINPPTRAVLYQMADALARHRATKDIVSHLNDLLPSFQASERAPQHQPK
jgi:hypothetical protein